VREDKAIRPSSQWRNAALGSVSPRRNHRERSPAGQDRQSGAPTVTVGTPLCLRYQVAGQPSCCWSAPLALTGSHGLVAAHLLQVMQLPLEMGLQTGAVVTLEGSQLVDLLLQQAALVT